MFENTDAEKEKLRQKKVDALMGGTVGGIPKPKENINEFSRVELFNKKEVVHFREP